MSVRARILLFGAAGGLVVTGVMCDVLVPGLTGQLLTIVLTSLGLGGAVLLLFLEVGLSEDRERARAEAARRERRTPRVGASERAWSIRPRGRRRPD